MINSKIVRFALNDPRRLARVRLLKADSSLPYPIPKLGWDPLLNWPTLSDFAMCIKRRSTSIKALLLDQSLFAGIGNWIADG